MKMTNKVYDTLKYIAQIVLPAVGTLYFALSGIWGLPYGEQIVGTVTAVDAFLGALLKISSDNYYNSEVQG
jgi:hypothetical protein